MLKQLSIQNYILIESLDFDFSDGFIVVTGETGAGKSIFIGALSLLLGHRLNKDVVGPYDDKTIIEGLFEFDEKSRPYQILQEAGFEGNEFIFSRMIDLAGKSTYRINRSLVTLNLVKDILEDEIDIHSQFNTQRLLDEKTHLDTIDSLLNDNQLIQEVHDLYSQLTKSKKEKSDFLKQQLSQEEIDYYTTELEKLEDLDLNVDEFQLINDQLKYQTDLKDSLALSYKILSVLDELNYSSLFDLIDESHEASEYIKSAYYQLDEAHHLVSKEIHSTDFDEETFNQLNSRAVELAQIQRKMKMPIEEILEYMVQLKQKIEDSSDIDKAIKRFDEKIEIVKCNFINKARILTEKRHQISKMIESFVVNHANDLNMKQMHFEVVFNEAFNERGLETAQFYVSMNKNMKPDLISKVASGGELSRLMLILKILFNENQPQKLIIFDEIDTGVSGKVAQLMGQKMYLLSKKHRLIAVTHLPIIAAFGDRHFKVHKSVNSTISFEELNKEQRIEELALMLGSVVNEKTLLAAHDLIQQTKDFHV